MPQATDHAQRQLAADRLMKHLLQKGRPAPYKERLIGVLADPSRESMPAAVAPALDTGGTGLLGGLVLAVEAWIRRVSDTNPQRRGPPARHRSAKPATAT